MNRRDIDGEIMAYKIRSAKLVSSDERLDKILKQLKGGTMTFVVVDNGKYKGIVTDATLKTFKHDPNKKAGKLAWKAPVLARDMPLDKIAERFTHGYRELPVCDDGKVVGVMRHTDILKSLLDEGRVPNRRVIELMSAPLISMDVNTNVAKAAAMMRQKGIHHLAVTDDGKFLGIVSTADVSPFIAASSERLPFDRERANLNEIELGTVLPSAEVHMIRQNASLSEAANEMVENDVSTLIVLDGQPVGLIHVIDILRASLPTAEPQFDISGLDEEDKEHRDDLRAEMVKILEKVERSFPIETAKLTIKKQNKRGNRSRYTLKFVLTGKKRIIAEASDWNLFKALHYVGEEVDKIAKSQKERMRSNKTPAMKRLSSRIQMGEFYPGKPVR